MLAHVLFALSSLLLAKADNAINAGFPYGSQKVRGVNLGGWLVLEPWITPSLFDNTGNPNIVDEWTFCQLQSRHAATTALQNHWSTFYTESDFEAIANAGCVRAPLCLCSPPPSNTALINLPVYRVG